MPDSETQKTTGLKSRRGFYVFFSHNERKEIK